MGKTWLALGFAQYQQADVDGALASFREADKLADGHAAAGEWIKYLESGKARDQALQAASERGQRDDGAVQLSGRLSGDPVAIGRDGQVGRGSCGESVCRYVEITVGAV